jgi:uncharacterized protein (DUF697 family)
MTAKKVTPRESKRVVRPRVRPPVVLTHARTEEEEPTMSDHQTATPMNDSEPIDVQAVEANPLSPAMLAEVRKLKCDITISKHVGAALGFGFIPLPFVDFVGISGVQLDMLYRLCRIYDIDFSTQAARSVIAALIGAGVPLQPLLTSSLKLIPGIGTAAGLFAAPTLAGASTYALGRVFVQHFETGGTLLTFDASKMKAHFEHALSEGKNVVAGMRGRKS